MMAVASSRGYDLRSRSAPVSSFGVMMAEQVRKSTPAASSRTHAIHSGEAWYVPMRILETVALTPHSTPPHRVIAMPIIRSFGVRSNVFSATAAPSPSLFAHRTPYTPHVSCSGSRSQTVRGRAEEVENLVHIRSDHRVRHGEDLVQRLAVPYFFD